MQNEVLGLYQESGQAVSLAQQEQREYIINVNICNHTED